MIRSLVIDGTPKSRKTSSRFRIYLNKKEVWLTCRSFSYLAKLGAARVIGDGWIYKDDLEPGHNQARYLYRMRRESGIGYQNDRQGYYRLDVDPAVIHFNHAQLSRFPDISVQDLFLKGE